MPLLPMAYPDELIGSLIIRGARRSGLPVKRALKAIFAGSRSQTGFLFSTQLERLGDLAGRPGAILLQNCTFFPYATAFYPGPERQQFAQRFLTADIEIAKTTSALISGVTVSVPYRRLCPQCAAEDYRLHGESYWRRSHHLPGVTACPKHACALRLTTISTGRLSGFDALHLPHDVAMASTADATCEVLPRVASTMAALAMNLLNGASLGRPGTVPDQDESCSAEQPAPSGWTHQEALSVYRAKALALGYVMKSGDVAAGVMSRDLRKLFGEGYLTGLGAGWEAKRSKYVPVRRPWPELMVRVKNPMPSPTIRHLLMLAFFANAEPTVIDAEREYDLPGKKSRDYRRLDQRTAARFQTAWNRLRRDGARATLKQVLTAAGIWNTYRHDRSQLPRVAAMAEEFKASNQSERQRGGRPYSYRRRLNNALDSGRDGADAV